jgi:hypothetical protein
MMMLCQWFMVYNAQAQARGQEQETERIHEEIEVVNVEVPVRVYYKGKPVKGLEKKDFSLVIDKKEREINGFYEVRKIIKSSPAQTEPRLFVLVFNIINDDDELQKGLDSLFGKVIRTGDRLMVLTNSLFLKDKMVGDPKEELEKLRKVLHVESLKMKQSLTSLEYNLRYLASSFKLECLTSRREPMQMEFVIKRFVEDYRGYLEEFKDKFFNPNQNLYLKITDYLREQKLEKWTLNFFQTPEFPLLKLSGSNMEIYNLIDSISKTEDIPNPYTQYIEIDLGKPDRTYIETIAKMFFNSGVTFHTILIKPKMGDFFEDYEYRPVPIESEHITRKITDLTGGDTVASNNLEKFLTKIAAKEDVYYMLTYAPQAGEGHGKIQVHTINNKFNTVYDNLQRPGYVKKAAQTLEKEIPQVRIRDVELQGNLIYAFISGVWLAEQKEGAKTGNILFNVKILNDQAMEISSTKKGFSCWAETIPIRLQMPALKKGLYQAIFEVVDTHSEKNDVELKEFKLDKDLILGPGEEEYAFIPAPAQAEAGTFTEMRQDPGALGQWKNALDSSISEKSMDPQILPRILEQVAKYCDRLRSTSLNFFCIEEINEANLKSLEWRGKDRKEENKFIYGYQLVKVSGKLLEKRALFEAGGQEEVKENAVLQTRFKYKHLVFGPLIFDRESQLVYHYTLIGKKDWKGKSVYIVEAVPKASKSGFVSGRFWVDEGDFSILRIETYQNSLRNFGEIEKFAGVHQLEPRITIINEYDIVTKGVRFPSKLYYEEAYQDKRGRMVVESLGNVTFRDYQFFAVETRITQESKGE